MKTVKVNHVVLTLRISPAGAGMSQAEIDELVNRRLAEGYDDVQINSVKTNFAERGDPTDLVQLYIFKKYANSVEASGEVAADNTSRGPGRPKKSDAS